MRESSETGFLLLVPHLIGVVVLIDIAEVAVIAHDPTAIDSEGVLVPVTLALLTPHLLITRREADAGTLVEVDAHADRLAILTGKHDDIAFLKAVQLSCTEVDSVGGYLQVPADDLGGSRQDLFRLWVDLHERRYSFAFLVLNNGDNALAGFELGSLLFIELTEVELLQHWIEQHIEITDVLTDQGERCKEG